MSIVETADIPRLRIALQTWTLQYLSISLYISNRHTYIYICVHIYIVSYAHYILVGNSMFLLNSWFIHNTEIQRSEIRATPRQDQVGL